MNNNKLLKILFLSVGCCLIIYVGFYFFTLTTSQSKQQKAIHVGKKMSEVEYKQYNVLKVNTNGFTLIVNNQQMNASGDSLLPLLTSKKQLLNQCPLIIVVDTQDAYPKAVNAFDAVAIAEIKRYEVVAEQ